MEKFLILLSGLQTKSLKPFCLQQGRRAATPALPAPPTVAPQPPWAATANVTVETMGWRRGVRAVLSSERGGTPNPAVALTLWHVNSLSSFRCCNLSQ